MTISETFNACSNSKILIDECSARGLVEEIDEDEDDEDYDVEMDKHQLRQDEMDDKNYEKIATGDMDIIEEAGDDDDDDDDDDDEDE